MRLKYSWNVPTRVQRMHVECTSECIYDCRGNLSNAARMQLKRPNLDARMSRMHLECISIAVGFYFDIFGTKRTQLECTSNADGIFRLPLECGSNTVGTSRLKCKNAFRCRQNLYWYFRYLKNPTRMHLECISIAVGIHFEIFAVLKECSWNALRMLSKS